MQIREDFKRLVEKFQRESSKQGKIDLLELFKESLKLFEKLKETLTHCSEEEKKQIIQLMAEMHLLLQNETKKIAERTGMSEDQLLRFSENPDNFSSSQWKALEVIKHKLDQTAKDLSGVIRTKPDGEGAKNKKNPDASKRPKSSKKDRWLRS